MTEIEKLRSEREQLFQDLYGGTIPKRVPVNIGVSIETCIQYAGLDMGRALITGDGLEEAVDLVCRDLHTDMFPRLQPRQPVFAQISGSSGMVMSQDGFMQHPESACMEEGEYPELIEDPYRFIVTKVMGRLFTNMGEDPVRNWMTLWMSVKAQEEMSARYGAIFERISRKYGFYRVPAAYNGKCISPVDQITSLLRGFTGMLKDIKRQPDMVREAAEAMLPLVMKRAVPSKKHPSGAVFIPLHMAPYMRPKEFETIYWPTFSKLVHGLAEMGYTCYCFCESNWERYVDYLQELPQLTRLHFEYGDPQKIKDQLGGKFILTGFYPLTLLRNGTKEQCVDKAKELLDILGPGGNYYFDLDKGILTLGDIVPENLRAVIDYVVEHGRYDNAGQPSVHMHREDTIRPCLKDIPDMKSQYYVSRQEYAAGHDFILADCKDAMFDMVQRYEDMMFQTVMGIL